MGLVKRTYTDGETVITAENLNDIQDAIIENEEAIEDQGEAIGGKYTKPSEGIPKTDLASGVQTSLGKADTALQSSDIDNTLTVSGKAADAKKTGDEISDVRNTLNQLESEIGIVVDGKSCALGASQGQFVILKNSTISGKSDGLYTAAQVIPAGEQNVTSAMLTGPIFGGGLNSLNSKILNIGKTFSTVTAGNGVTIVSGGYMKIGHIVILAIRIKTTTTHAINDILFSNIPFTGFAQYFSLSTGYDMTSYSARTGGNGGLYANTALPTDTEFSINGAYVEHF